MRADILASEGLASIQSDFFVSAAAARESALQITASVVGDSRPR